MSSENLIWFGFRMLEYQNIRVIDFDIKKTLLYAFVSKLHDTFNLPIYIQELSIIPCITRILTWILGVVSKLPRVLHGRVGDSTALVNSLSPQMSELVEDAVASWCGDIVWHFRLIRNQLQKFVELKFELFSFNTFDVSQIFWQRIVQPRPKYSYCIFLNGFCWVSVCWILNNALCSMSRVFSGFYFVPHCAINIWHNMLCYLPNIYN